MGVVGDIVNKCLTTDPASKITLGVCIVFILLSIRCIFFDPTSKEELKDKQGVFTRKRKWKINDF